MKRFIIFFTAIVSLGSCGTYNSFKLVSYTKAEAPMQNEITEVNASNSEVFRNLNSKQNPCDSIFLTTGESILANIKLSGRDKVHYTNCGDENGREYSVSTVELSSIVFSSGTTITYGEKGEVVSTSRGKRTEQAESVEEPESSKVPETKEAPLKDYTQARNTEEYRTNAKRSKLALIAGGLSFIPVIGWIFSLIAIILGSILVTRTKNDPVQGDINKRASTGVSLGTVSLIIGVLLVLLTLILFFL